MNTKVFHTAVLLLRIALAAAFASAVADRFGIWGQPGTKGVSWGDLSHFNAYVAKLNWFLLAAIIPALSWITTALETLLALALLIGWQIRWISLASALLLSSFALTMAVALGLKAPLDYSVFTAASAAFLLFAVTSPITNNKHINAGV
jgi:hypothetical protein